MDAPRIFFDLDETLIHALIVEPDEPHHYFEWELGFSYYVVVRPGANEIIQFARDLVGPDNVFILTRAGKEYSIKICSELFNIPEENVLHNNLWIDSSRRDYNNFIIDDEPAIRQDSKILYLNMGKDWHDRYLQIRKFWGVLIPNSNFLEDVKRFLTSRISQFTILQNENRQK